MQDKSLKLMDNKVIAIFAQWIDSLDPRLLLTFLMYFLLNC